MKGYSNIFSTEMTDNTDEEQEEKSEEKTEKKLFESIVNNHCTNLHPFSILCLPPVFPDFEADLREVFLAVFTPPPNINTRS